MAISNRYNSLARPYLQLTKYGFHMQSMENDIQKLY